MKKLILIVGMLIACTAILESCKATYPNSGRMKRPQRHPRYPRKMALVTPEQIETSTITIG